jgi:hypothetical protein
MRHGLVDPDMGRSINSFNLAASLCPKFDARLTELLEAIRPFLFQIQAAITKVEFPKPSPILQTKRHGVGGFDALFICGTERIMIYSGGNVKKVDAAEICALRYDLRRSNHQC